mmetsp:Transcript_29380/g.44838  ORF Transcript_29380/g.44838 Transcript_29380/m.44838 type:complete len:626 (-) Transcript_29380:192-2069(-)
MSTDMMNGKRKGDDLIAGKEAKRHETEKEAPTKSSGENRIDTGTSDRHVNGNGRGNGGPRQQLRATVNRHPVESHHSVLPLTMQLMKPFWSIACDHCAPSRHPESTPSFVGRDGEVAEFSAGYDSNSLLCGSIAPPPRAEAPTQTNAQEIAGSGKDRAQLEPLVGSSGATTRDEQVSKVGVIGNGDERDSSSREVRIGRVSSKCHLEEIPPTPRDHTLSVLTEYVATAKMYGCGNTNPGVLTTLRFSLPTLRVSGSFHDSDMLALSEVLFRHCNGALKHIRRLDFSIGGRFGKLHGRKGFGSHGAFTLSRVLCISKHIEEVLVQHNKIGPYGAGAIFSAVAKNNTVKVLIMRRCLIGEKGGIDFAKRVGSSKNCGLREVDLSVNRIGFRGSIEIEEMLIQKENENNAIEVDLEGNLVLQEIMSGVTHGLGFILCIIGASTMSNKVKGQGLNKVVSCGAYSLSLLILYFSSTLYHSLFALKYTRYIFECLDHCAIYILITGSYTPFLRIALEDKPLGSFYLLIFLYLCCAGGVIVEAFYNTWIYKPKFSLAMYLGMGWSCLICMPDMMKVLPQEAINLIILGGVGYTAGVPFFVRNNNLDHSIWHCFVLSGSMCHWFCIYLYVVDM